jgi:hypothetical protein
VFLKLLVHLVPGLCLHQTHEDLYYGTQASEQKKISVAGQIMHLSLSLSPKDNYVLIPGNCDVIFHGKKSFIDVII